MLQDYKDLFDLGIEKLISDINHAKLENNLDSKAVNSVLSIIKINNT